MGLSSTRVKQRIPDDPRNVKWAKDTEAPGFRLLSSMGWTPDAPGLGNADSQSLISAGGSSAYNKKISIIPTAKEDNLGIGARRGGAGIGGLRAMGLGAQVGSMGFVSAAAPGEAVVEKEVKGTGGEFGRLLERLNRASASASVSAASSVSAVEETGSDEAEKAVKKSKKEGKKRKRDKEEEEPVVAVVEPAPVLVAEAAPASPAVLHNPRNAARSKHLRAKRMASSDAVAMAAILGIAPPGAPTAPSPSLMLPSSVPAIAYQTAPTINGPADNGWPVAPIRKFPVFASSSTKIEATFEEPAPSPNVVEVVNGKSEEDAEKERKKEKKEKKRRKKEGLPEEEVATVVDIPAPAPTTAPRAFPSFTSSSTTGLAATFVPEAKEEVKAEVEVSEEERKAIKKAKKEERKRAKAEKVALTA